MASLLPYSVELLKGACLAHGLAAPDGDDAATLHARLGAHLVADLLLAPNRARPAKRSAKRSAKRKARPSAPSASRGAWRAFVAHERPLVAQAGLSGRAAVQELAARWKRFKARDGPDAPLMLPAPASEAGSSSSSSAASEAATHDDDDHGDEAALEGLRAALADLDGAELAEALAAHGLPDGEGRAAGVDALARALLGA